MLRSLYNGVSGIRTHGVGIDVTADNIANISNVGFKSSRPEFKSIFYQTSVESGYFSGANQVGLGATMQTTALQMSQGNLIDSDNNFDLAISGNGYFGVMGADKNIYYTRDGAFDIDKEGNLVTNNGEYVIGTMANFTQTTLSDFAKKSYGELYKQSGKTPILDAYMTDPKTKLTIGTETAQQPIKLPKYLYMPAVATSYVNFRGTLDVRPTFKDTEISVSSTNTQNKNDNGTLNLNGNILDSRLKPGDSIKITLKDKNSNIQTANAKIKDNGTWSIENLVLNGQIDKQSPLDISLSSVIKQEVPNTSTFYTDVFSPTGEKNRLQINFTKNIPSQGEGSIWQVKANLFSPANALISSSSGEVTFDGRGMLKSSTLGSIDNGGSPLNINLGTPGSANASNMLFAGMVAREHKSKITDIQKDGAGEGLFNDYKVGDNGVVYANFSNATSIEVAKIPLFHFQNEQGLHKEGGTLFSKSANSGDPFFYKDTRGNLVYGAQIKPNFLEQSNVDLGEQLTELIVLQKGFDASSKSITTSNEMLKTAIGLKK